MQAVEERREFQRLRVDPSIPGTFGATAVALVEAGVLGARMHHGAPLDEKTGELRFSYDGEEIALRCEVVRTMNSQNAKYPGSGLESGVRFIAALGESGDRLREMLAVLVTRALEDRRDATLTGVGRAVDGDRTVRGTDASFLSYRFEKGVWQRRRIFLPEQPPVGFTVARTEDSEEMQHLCSVYQTSDDEGRRLIRMFAELSVSEALNIPPRV